MVAAVVLVFVFIFCTVLLFHLVQQNRYNTATQLESIARSVREPLSSAILKGDIPEAEAILASIKPAGVVSRADVVLPNQFQALRKSFIPERPVPVMVLACLSYRFKSRWVSTRSNVRQTRSQLPIWYYRRIPSVCISS